MIPENLRRCPGGIGGRRQVDAKPDFGLRPRSTKTAFHPGLVDEVADGRRQQRRGPSRQGSFKHSAKLGERGPPGSNHHRRRRIVRKQGERRLEIADQSHIAAGHNPRHLAARRRPHHGSRVGQRFRDHDEDRAVGKSLGVQGLSRHRRDAADCGRHQQKKALETGVLHLHGGRHGSMPADEHRNPRDSIVGRRRLVAGRDRGAGIGAHCCPQPARGSAHWPVAADGSASPPRCTARCGRLSINPSSTSRHFPAPVDIGSARSCCRWSWPSFC